MNRPVNRFAIGLAFKMNFALASAWALALVSVSGLAMSLGCGVRGDPLPPADPPILGRGTPDFPKLENNLKNKVNNKLKNKKDSKGSTAFRQEEWDSSEDQDEMRDDKNE